MDETINLNFRNVDQAIDDLMSLSDPEIYTSLGALSFHFNEAKRKIKKSVKKNYLGEFPNIERFFNKNLEKIIEEYLFKNKRLNQANISIDSKLMELNHSNIILDILPIIIRMSEIFSMSSSFDFKVSKGVVSIGGCLTDKIDINGNKEIINSIILNLLDHNIVTTFNLEQIEDGDPRLQLKFDISHDPNLAFRIDLREKLGLEVYFPNMVSNYFIHRNKLESLGKHLILEITEDLTLNRFNQLPPHILFDKGEQRIFHFHFLFCPISIIIPKEGEIIPYSAKSTQNTGCGDGGFSNKDVGKDSIRTLHFIDLFSFTK